MITATKMIRLLISAGFIAAMGFLLSHDLRALNYEAALASVQNTRPVSPKPGYTENGALLST
jgi:hypothetical protein